MTKKQLIITILIFIFSVIFSACGGGNAKAGEELYSSRLEINGYNPCYGCHTLDGTEKAAPSYLGLAERAATRVEGMTAEDYLKESIVDPEAFVVEEFKFHIPMPTDFGEMLTEKQIDDLVAFLLTQ